MKGSLVRRFFARIDSALAKGELSFPLPSTAIAVSYLTTLESAPWLRHLALAGILSLLACLYWNWALNCARRLGDAAAPIEADDDLLTPQNDNPAISAAAFEDRIDAAITRASHYSRHAGIVSLWWASGVDVDGQTELETLRKALAAKLNASCVVHFVDDDRAWVLVNNLRAFDELLAVQNQLVEFLVHQNETPLRTVAAGAAMAPMHGYDARSLVEFADGNLAQHVRVHPFKTFARQLGRTSPALPSYPVERERRVAV